MRFPPSGPPALISIPGRRSARAAVLMAMVTGAAAAAAPERAFRVERLDEADVIGAVRSIGPETLVVETDAGSMSLPVSSVRRLERPRADQVATPAPPVTVTCSDGSTLTGSGFESADGVATLTTAAGPIRLPSRRLRLVRLAPAGEGPPDWADSIPEATEADLLVVSKGDDVEFVECAIMAVTADQVLVILDDERLPVKRTKVIGLRWLEADEAPPVAGATVVDTCAGRFRAGTVAWSAAGVTLDGVVSMPPAAVDAVDFAAGRRISLASEPPERVDIEPYFGGLAKIDGVSEAFAPRRVPSVAGGGPSALIMHPRTVISWRIPEHARRFRTTVAATTTRPAASPAVVTIAVDGREAARRTVATAAEPVDLDVAGGRRLTVTVEFAAAGGGGAVRLDEPVIEK